MSVTLKSKDGKEFKLSQEAINLSKFLKEKTKDKNELVLDDVNGETLALVVDYLEHYSKNELS